MGSASSKERRLQFATEFAGLRLNSMKTCTTLILASLTLLLSACNDDGKSSSQIGTSTPVAVRDMRTWSDTTLLSASALLPNAFFNTQISSTVNAGPIALDWTGNETPPLTHRAAFNGAGPWSSVAYKGDFGTRPVHAGDWSSGIQFRFDSIARLHARIAGPGFDSGEFELTSGSLATPIAAVDAEGNASFVWTDDKRVLIERRFAKGMPVGDRRFESTEHQILASPNTVAGEGWLVDCEIVPTGASPMVFVTRIRTRRLSAKDGLSEAVELQTDDAGVCLATANTQTNGRAQIVWFSRDDATKLDSAAVFARSFDGQAWGSTLSLGGARTDSRNYLLYTPLSLSADQQGNFIIGWPSLFILDMGNLKSVGAYVGGANATVVTTPLREIVGMTSATPSAYCSGQDFPIGAREVHTAIRADGEALLGFHVGNDVQVATRTNGVWSAPIKIDPPQAGLCTEAFALAYDSFGKPTMAWDTLVESTRKGMPDNTIWFSQRDAAGNWSAPFAVVEHVSLAPLTATFGRFPFIGSSRVGATGLTLFVTAAGPLAVTWYEQIEQTDKTMTYGPLRARAFR